MCLIVSVIVTMSNKTTRGWEDNHGRLGGRGQGSWRLTLCWPRRYSGDQNPNKLSSRAWFGEQVSTGTNFRMCEWVIYCKKEFRRELYN